MAEQKQTVEPQERKQADQAALAMVVQKQVPAAVVQPRLEGQLVAEVVGKVAEVAAVVGKEEAAAVREGAVVVGERVNS